MFTVQCPKHPRYEGKSKPKGCDTCAVFYIISLDNISKTRSFTYEDSSRQITFKFKKHDCKKEVYKKFVRALNKSEKSEVPGYPDFNADQ